MTPERHRKLYLGIARCIASVPQEYHADLCRDFRINPKDVEEATVSSTDRREGRK